MALIKCPKCGRSIEYTTVLTGGGFDGRHYASKYPVCQCGCDIQKEMDNKFLIKYREERDVAEDNAKNWGLGWE